jgi:hypothetical protein
MSEKPITTTYSSWQMFLDCQRKYFWRYVREKVLVGQKAAPLFFGSGIHEALKVWHTTGDLAAVNASLAISFGGDPTLAVARLMMQEYAVYYTFETFKVYALEHEFAGGILNPKSGRRSRKFQLRGKVDGIVIEETDGFVLEHKTAALLNKNYLDALWTDFQTILYSHYIKTTEKIPIKGVIYNVLLKPRADIKDVAKWYEKENRFHRETLIFSQSDFDRVSNQLWQLTQQLQFCLRKNQWVQNTKQCFVYNRQCPYYQICKSDDNPMVIENYYEHKPAHSELSADTEANDLL